MTLLCVQSGTDVIQSLILKQQLIPGRFTKFVHVIYYILSAYGVVMDAVMEILLKQ